MPLAAAPPTLSLRPQLRPADHFKRAAKSVDSILSDARLTGRVAFAVSDARSGKTLESREAMKGKPPASVTKAITALYALETLGADHRFETRVIATGGVKNGEVQGDLVLVGGCDPTLDTDALGQMAGSLKTAGIIGVKGDFLIYDAALPVLPEIDPKQPSHVGYNPGISGLALNFNRVHFEWRRGGNGYSVTMDGRSKRYRPDVAMAVMRIENRSTPIYTYRDGQTRDEWTVARGALGKGGARWLPVRKPGLYAGDVFATLAGAQGIRLSKPKRVDVLPDGDLILAHRSNDLRSIARDMLKFSTNLTAEMIGLAASMVRGAAPADLKASAQAMNAWAQSSLGMAAPALVDHSGLGDDSRLTADDMVRGLVAVRESDFKDILKPIALRDHKGRPVKDHPIKVAAKTGTLNFVSSLAGYVDMPDGVQLAFAIFAADEDIRATIPRSNREAPKGGRSWNRRAKRMQQALIERWALVYADTPS